MTTTDTNSTNMYRLLQDMQGFTERTGWGLGEAWGLLNHGKVAKARERMDLLLSEEHQGLIPQRHRRTR
jgi:hypothetical protein